MPLIRAWAAYLEDLCTLSDQRQVTFTWCRRASKRVLTVLQRFGIAEKLGMDEVIVDGTVPIELMLPGSFIISADVHSSSP